MPEGYTYENQAGGWSMCDICGNRVTDTDLHTRWHRALTAAIAEALLDFPGGQFDWNEPPKADEEANP